MDNYTTGAAPPVGSPSSPKEAVSDSESPPILRLFLRRSESEQPNFLASLIRLDIWGDTPLLSFKVRNEMAAGYVILSVVLIFEVVAWTLLFHSLLQSANMATFFRFLAALLIGVLWGVGIFTIDKGLMTMDLSVPGMAKWKGFVARVLLVMVSAFLTAQPVEQMVFQGVIEERLKRETLREEAVAYLQRINERRERANAARAKPWTDYFDKRVTDKLDAAEERLRQSLETLQAAKSAQAVRTEELQRRKLERDALRARLAQVRLDETKRPLAAHLTGLLYRAEGRVQQLNKELVGLNSTLAHAETARLVAERAQKDARGEYGAEKEKAARMVDDNSTKLEGEGESIRTFVDSVRRARYGEQVELPNGRGLLRWKQADFIERGIIVGDLVAGRPPRWPQVESSRRSAAANLFELPDTASSGGDSMLMSWLVVLVVAAAIPSLSILFKFTTSDELKAYYSRASQARAGDPAAQLHKRAQLTMEEGVGGAGGSSVNSSPVLDE